MVEIKGAAKLMENLFDEGIYQAYKLAEHKSKSIKEEIKKRVITNKDFSSQGVVVRYIKQPVYSINTTKLNEFLHDIGILTKVARFNKSEELQDFMNPIEYFTKFNIGKLGKTEKEVLDFGERFEEEQLINLWVRSKDKMNFLEKEIDLVKEEMIKCPILKVEKKLQCTYGSVSLLAKAPTYDNAAILEYFGDDFLIQNSKPNMEELEKFITKGFLTHSDLDKFRVIENINSKFVIMTSSSYQKQGEMIHSKRMRQAKNLQELWANAK